MKVAIFSTKSYDRKFLQEMNAAHDHELVFFEPHLTQETIPLAAGFPAICAFVNDELNASVLKALADPNHSGASEATRATFRYVPANAVK